MKSVDYKKHTYDTLSKIDLFTYPLRACGARLSPSESGGVPPPGGEGVISGGHCGISRMAARAKQVPSAKSAESAWDKQLLREATRDTWRFKYPLRTWLRRTLRNVPNGKHERSKCSLWNPCSPRETKNVSILLFCVRQKIFVRRCTIYVETKQAPPPLPLNHSLFHPFTPRNSILSHFC